MLASKPQYPQNSTACTAARLVRPKPRRVWRSLHLRVRPSYMESGSIPVKISTADILQLREIFRAVQVHTILWRQTHNRFVDQLVWMPDLNPDDPGSTPGALSLLCCSTEKGKKEREGRKGKGFFFVARDRAAVQLQFFIE